MTEQQPAAEASVTVPVDPAAAFGAFTAGLGSWWPVAYSWGPERLDRHALEPVEGGRVTEFSDDGTQHDWGRVVEWSPSSRLVIAWMIGPDRVVCPDSPSRVTVTFTGDDASTEVAVVHDRFDAHGEGGHGYADALDSDRGWPFILAEFAATLDG